MSDTSPLALNSGLTGNIVSSTGFGGPSPLGPQSPMDAYAKKMEGLSGKAEAEEKRHEAEVNPMRERLERSLQGGVGAPPKGEKIERPPSPQDYHKYSMEFASGMAVLGALAGKFTRMGGTGALNAFAGAIKGWQQGNLEAYNEGVKEWEQKTKQTLENNRQRLDKAPACDCRPTLDDLKTNENLEQQPSRKPQTKIIVVLLSLQSKMLLRRQILRCFR